MDSSFTFKKSFLFAFLLLCQFQVVLAGKDHIEASRLRNSGEILPLEVMLENVRQSYPGKILEVELKKEHDRLIYEVEILSEDGVVTEVYIDARTGKLLFAKEEN